ncbi:ABC transporter substrate-binding protein [Streptomyces rimosus]|uniref:ABC transporter substrate-binding protein n=1 Tax=Streptomyces rimosus TaxID=1927 RepID=UPI0037D7CEB2
MLNWLYNTFWATLIRKVCTVLVVLAVVVPLALILPGRIGAPEYCAEGVERSAGECVGVSGSGYDFGTGEIREVARAIGAENKRISEQERDLVTIAMMLPLQPKSAAERKQLRSELQGAYLAQWRANRTENKPLLRLVLANPGADYAQQEKVVDRLAAMADSRRDNLRAVTGFNLSLGNTKAAIDRLTNELHIPVLASRVSADEIANADNGSRLKYPGLARIIPTNRQQAAALADFHGGLRDAETVLVKDMRPNDIYDESLAKAFSRPEPGPPGPKDQPFTSPGINDPGDTGNDFTTIAHNICESDAKVVYFAGRPVHLRLFALKLAEVPCHGKKYTAGPLPERGRLGETAG